MTGERMREGFQSGRGSDRPENDQDGVGIERATRESATASFRVLCSGTVKQISKRINLWFDC